MDRWIRVYGNHLEEMGYSPCSAVPLSSATYRTLLDSLLEEATRSTFSPLASCLAWRDGALVSTLWSSALRGHDGALLRYSGITSAEGRPLLPMASPPPAGVYFVRPWTTKVAQHPLPIQLEYPR